MPSLSGPDRSKDTPRQAHQRPMGLDESLDNAPVARRELTTVLPPPAPASELAKSSKTHHTFLRTFANLHAKDKTTEWWTVRDENKMYELKDQIPFQNLFCHMGEGGLVVYLDKPKGLEDRVKVLETALKDMIRLATEGLKFEQNEETKKSKFLRIEAAKYTAFV